MNKKIILFAAFFYIIGINLVVVNGQVIEKKTITLNLAKMITNAAVTAAVENNLAAVVVIVDDGGNLILLEKMDNAQIGSIEVAIQKARTAIYFKRSTKAYEERVTSGNNAILKVPNILPFEGGLPLIVEGEYIGAIGVSGGTPQQDGIVAQAGVKILNKK